VHQAKLGTVIITVANTSEDSCANHSYTLVTNYQCALREGVADYHQNVRTVWMRNLFYCS